MKRVWHSITEKRPEHAFRLREIAAHREGIDVHDIDPVVVFVQNRLDKDHSWNARAAIIRASDLTESQQLLLTMELSLAVMMGALEGERCQRTGWIVELCQCVEHTE